MKPTLLILAAGMGSRYGGLKQLDGVGPHEEVIIEYSIYDAIRAGFGKVVFVIRKDIEEAFRETLGNKFADKIDVAYAFQAVDSPIEGLTDIPHREKPWGTAHAVLVAQDQIDQPFAVINADDYYGIQSFADMARFLSESCSPTHYAMVGYELRKTLSDAGHVNRGVCQVDEDGFLTNVVERLKVKQEGDRATYEGQGEEPGLPLDTKVSMNFWGFHPNVFDPMREQFLEFVEAHRDQPRAEFFIPLVAERLIQEGAVKISVLPSQEKWYGVTYKEDKAAVVDAFQQLTADGHYPSPLWST